MVLYTVLDFFWLIKIMSLALCFAHISLFSHIVAASGKSENSPLIFPEDHETPEVLNVIWLDMITFENHILGTERATKQRNI